MKLRHGVTFVLMLIIPLTSVLLAQQTPPSLADLARQERERRKQLANKLPPASTGNSAGKQVAGAAGLSTSFQANILITDSKSAIEKWVLLPVANRPGAGRLHQVTPGMKIYLPFVVTNYNFPASENMNLTAHVRISGPDGKTLLDEPRMSGAIKPDPRSPNVIVLNPVIDLTFDASDLPGTYTIRVTIADNVHGTDASAEETFQLIRAARASPGSTSEKRSEFRHDPLRAPGGHTRLLADFNGGHRSSGTSL